MSGWFEVRVDGPSRHHHRLFCLLDHATQDRTRPLLVIITGLDKPFRTTLSPADYKSVRMLGEEYLSRNPRSLNRAGRQATAASLRSESRTSERC
jgi:hypothetical protein